MKATLLTLIIWYDERHVSAYIHLSTLPRAVSGELATKM